MVMVARDMLLTPIIQCSRTLDFGPLRRWPQALPALAWRGHLVCAFERQTGLAVNYDNSNQVSSLIELIKGCYPELGLGELARLSENLATLSLTGDTEKELLEPLFQGYGMRWCDRLRSTLARINSCPREFQDFADIKGFSVRDFSALLALPESTEFTSFLRALARLPCSKSEATKILELGAELFLLGNSVSELLPSNESPTVYLYRLEQRRHPRTTLIDQNWKSAVNQWPWPPHVQGQWQRFGDQSGLEIKIRATSPEDLNKKLQNLFAIGDAWSCKM